MGVVYELGIMGCFVLMLKSFVIYVTARFDEFLTIKQTWKYV